MQYQNIFDITPHNLVLLAMRSCVANRNCNGIKQILHDWFGNDAEHLMHNAQILVWANQTGMAQYSFSIYNYENTHKNEQELLKGINLIIYHDDKEAKNIAAKIGGNLSDFSYKAMQEIAKIMKKIIFLGDDNRLKA